MILNVQHIWILLLIPVVLGVLWFRSKHAASLNITWRVHLLQKTWRLRLRRILPWLRMTSLILIVIAAAGPFHWRDFGSIPVEGVAIELVVDRSGSMLEDDYYHDGERVTRLEAVSTAAAQFVFGDSENGVGRSDSIGLVTFAALAEIACPLTLDHEAVVAELERTEPAADYREDGTAIGDSWTLAISELRRIDEISPYPVSKTIILLTDGQQNSGRLSPERAAAFARHFGIKTYVIGLEPQSIQAEVARKRIEEERNRLEDLARSTGGQFFHVTQLSSLEEAYRDIYEQERTLVGERVIRIKSHFAVSNFSVGQFDIPPLILLLLIFLFMEISLRWTLLREII
ncbi:von Willebrand factor type A domain protein [Polystyrenella longa]|uniref:von Willebrand factor type A domain protein n=1 Tax=Polystyrenella longa TaxID=2528007 RepID=A0A518CNI3_9PLAN|nr:VWA domain-containing protein [Polystyrenella longa]QDU80779.1 von Willebrand factor type A domain protein [Polystyrenella longa]